MDGAQVRSREEIIDHRDARRLGVLDDIGGRIKPQKPQALRAVGIEQGPVVATDVDDQVAAFQLDGGFRVMGDPRQVGAHGLVDAGAVPVTAIKDVGRDGMFQLHQAAGFLVQARVASDQIQRDSPLNRRLALWIGKSAGDILVPEAEHRSQRLRPANPAEIARH